MPKNTISGGKFQDPEGRPLSNGYITMELCTDVQEPSGPSQVVGGLTLKINLDNNGNIADTISLWPNDLLVPANSCYLVDAFTEDGTRAWKSPQYQKVLSSPSPFDISVWVPTPNGGCGCGNENSNIPRITLETNGVVNVNQLVENLIAGPGIGLVNDAGGGTTITANGVGITLQTNSVNNNSQTKLNLESTDSTVTLTDLGAGNINVQAQKILLQSNGVNNASQTKLNLRSTDSTVTVTDAGSGNVNLHVSAGAGNTFTALPSWWMCCDGSNYPFNGSNGQFSSGTANVPQFWMIRIPYTIAITTATFRFNAAGVGGVGGMAVYNSAGSVKLVSFDNFAFSGGAGAKVISNTFGTTTLSPGVYIVASSQSNTGASATTQGGYITQGSSDVTNGWNANATPRSGLAANLMVTGVLPSSLGVLSLSASAPQVSLPCVCFEP